MLNLKHNDVGAVFRGPGSRLVVIWAAVSLALAAALSYLLIGWNILSVGNLQEAEAPAGIIYVCSGCYIVGGLLILFRWRGLWITGAAINAMVILFFFAGYINRPEVIFSPGGLATKTAQLLLEIALLHLIFTHWRRTQHLPG
jgi:hypothetical protein